MNIKLLSQRRRIRYLLTLLRDKAKQPKKLLPFLVIVIAIILILAAIAFYLNRKYNFSGQQNQPAFGPTPTLEPTADWTIYTSQSKDYSFKYPGTDVAVVDKNPVNLCGMANLTNNLTFHPAGNLAVRDLLVVMTSTENQEKIPLKDWLLKNCLSNINSINLRPESIIVNGIPAEKFTIEDQGKSALVGIGKQTKIYLFYGTDISSVKSSQLFNQVIATFNFSK